MMVTVKPLLVSVARTLLAITLLATSLQAEQPVRPPSFYRLQLTNKFLSEGATAADINRDGHVDIISGPYWYAGPDFAQRTEYYEAKPYEIDSYSGNFFAFCYDFNNDRWQDILILGFPGKETYWYENQQGKPGHWPRHLAYASVDNESPTFADLTGDGRPELVFHTEGSLGYAEIPHDDPTSPWHFRPISPNLGFEKYNHGLGVGDLNGDGRADLLEKRGWWEQPASPASKQWTFHEVAFSQAGGAQMLVADLDGDGDNDVVTSKDAHGYGLAWFENRLESGVPSFQEHTIMGQQPHENEHGVAFSQLHALALADMNGDGIEDIVTGKRFWAHRGHDPGGHDPAVLYWFKTVREAGMVRFVPSLIDNNSGVGTQVAVADLNGDQKPDIVVGNKKGTFALIQHAKKKGNRSRREGEKTANER